MNSVVLLEGATIEEKVERLVANKEPIKDGAPKIFTERKEGIVQAYNIRADRWEIAAEAMDLVQKNTQAKRDARNKPPEEEKAVKESGTKGVVEKVEKVGETETT